LGDDRSNSKEMAVVIGNPKWRWQAEITGEVLTGRFSSSTAVTHSASFPPGKVNRVAAYQW